MLSLGAPAALWFLAAAIPVIVLHLLRRRFRRRPAGSIFLWRRIEGTAPGARRPELRSDLLLALQVAAVLLAALAASSPAWVERRLAAPGRAFVVDVSASMGAGDLADSKPSYANRVEAAAAAARAAIDAAAPEGPVAVFAAAAGLVELCPPTEDRARAKASLAGLAPTDAGFEEDRVAAALAAWLALRPEAWDILILTDGGLDLGGSRLSALGGASVAFETIGRSGGGVGLASLRVTAGAKAGEASFRAWNGLGAAATGRLLLEHDGAKAAEADIRLAPGWSDLRLPLPGGPSRGAWTLGLSVEGSPASMVRLADFPQRERRVLFVGRDDPYVRAALAFPGISLFVAPTLPEPDKLRGYDLVIAEGLRVPSGLPTALLSIAAIPEGAPLAPAGLAEGGLVRAARAHPLAERVPWKGTRASQALAVEAGPGVSPLAAIGDRVVAAAWTEGGLPRLFLGFDPSRSDFGLSAGWPILLGDFLDWCAPRLDDQSAHTLVAGRPARRTFGPSFALEGPGAPTLSRQGPFVTLEGRRQGLFRFESEGGSGYLAVNPPASELDLAPRVLPPQASRPPSSSTLRTRSTDLAALPLALLVAALAAEWILWRGLPFRRGRRGRGAAALPGAAKGRAAGRTGTGARGRARGDRLIRPAFLLRLLALAAAAAALSGTPLPFPSEARGVVYLFDASASIGAERLEAEREAALASIAALAPRDRVYALAFAGRPRLLGGPWEPGEAAQALGAASLEAPDPDATDLAAGLSAALDLAAVPRLASSEIVVLGDLRDNSGGGALAGLPLRAGVPVHIVPIGREPSGLLSLGLSAPARARPGTKASLSWRLESDAARTVDYEVVVDGTAARAASVSIPEGVSEIPLEVEVGDRPLARIEVRALGEDGLPLPRASSGAALAVDGAPSILVAAGSGSPSPIVAALAVQGIASRSLSVEELPETPADCAGLSAIVLDDVPALALSEAQQGTLAAFASSGGGLLFVGGASSLGRGEYYATDLGDLLPVETDTRQRLLYTRARLLFLIDSSGSMSQLLGEGTKQLAAMRAVEAAVKELNPDDEVGVVSFDSSPTWILPFTPAAKSRIIDRGIASIPEGGGTDLASALEAAIRGFGPPGPAKRHIIALTDGITVSADWEGVVAALKDAGITLSTVAIGLDANEGLLRGLAEADGGVYYRAEGDRLPRILDEETLRLTRELVREGSFPVEIARESPLTAGLARVPPIRGYLLARAKPLATVFLSARSPGAEPRLDPLLATWNYGAGAVAVFTSDSGRRWLGPWAGTPAFPRFWSQLVRSVERPAAASALRARAEVSGSGAVIVVEARRPDGRRWPGLSIAATEAGSLAATLEETAPGRYEGKAALGSTGLHVYELRSAEGLGATAWLWYQPGIELGALGPDLEAASRLARDSGGSLLDPARPTLPAPRPGFALLPARLPFSALAILALLLELWFRSALAGHIASALEALASWARLRSGEARRLAESPLAPVVGASPPPTAGAEGAKEDHHG